MQGARGQWATTACVADAHSLSSIPILASPLRPFACITLVTQADASVAQSVKHAAHRAALVATPGCCCVQTLVALAAEPLASLVDTMWLGRIGPPELAACAAAQAVFNLVTKLVNIPLTAVTVSMIAQASAPAEAA
jgi:hypothetical protein